MINNYSDHSANERTYLAWVRTSITIMAFGFLIEKFELFIAYVGKVVKDEKHFQPSLYAELVGLSLFLVGMLIILIATWRFFRHKDAIESNEVISYSVKKVNIFLSALIIIMGIFIFFYMGNQILS